VSIVSALTLVIMCVVERYSSHDSYWEGA